jgi:hypothetical protein
MQALQWLTRAASALPVEDKQKSERSITLYDNGSIIEALETTHMWAVMTGYTRLEGLTACSARAHQTK